jgi:hypothetical protein
MPGSAARPEERGDCVRKSVPAERGKWSCRKLVTGINDDDIDYPDGTTAKFYINDDYVHPMSKKRPAFWINGEYWYSNPPAGTPAFRASGKFVYEHAAAGQPRCYLG